MIWIFHFRRCFSYRISFYLNFLKTLLMTKTFEMINSSWNKWKAFVIQKNDRKMFDFRKVNWLHMLISIHAALVCSKWISFTKQVKVFYTIQRCMSLINILLKEFCFRNMHELHLLKLVSNFSLMSGLN